MRCPISIEIRSTLLKLTRVKAVYLIGGPCKSRQHEKQARQYETQLRPDPVLAHGAKPLGREVVVFDDSPGLFAIAF